MEITEKLVGSGRERPDGNVDGMVGKNDDFELEIIAFKFFRMVVPVDHLQGEWPAFWNNQTVRIEVMFFQVEGVGLSGGSPGPGRKEKNGSKTYHAYDQEISSPVPWGDRTCHRVRPAWLSDFAGIEPDVGAVLIWDIRQSPANMTARYPQTVIRVMREGRAL
jgi:hypothetical protein